MRARTACTLVLIVLAGCTTPLPSINQAGPALVARLAQVGPAQLDPDTQGTALNLQQTVGDVTVTVDWAYADQEQVVLGYTVAARRVAAMIQVRWP